MNQESTDQIQGQESASIVDTTTLKNQLLDTLNIQFQNSEITQDCSLDKIENLTSSHEITKTQQSIVTQVPSEAQKSLIRNLYFLLVCEKLPATEENKNCNKKTEEFIEILEVLSEPCDKIKRHDSTKNCDKIEEMTKNVRLRIEKIKIEKSISTLLNDEAKLENIAQKYENLKADDILMKILFHKCYQVRDMCQTRCVDGNEAVGNVKLGNESSCQKESKIFSAYNENFKELKNFRSGNQKFVLKDLCDTFESVVVPKTQKMISSVQSVDNLTWNALDDSTKTIILKSFIDLQGFYIPLQELVQNNPEHFQNLNPQQIMDIIQYGFTKVSKIGQLNIPFYLKRTFIWKHMAYFSESSRKHQMISEHTKNYDNLKEELKVRKILILTDELGNGKTTTLKYFARRFKEDDNKLWISYIDARLSPKIFDRIHRILNWNVECIADFVTKILQLSGIEVPIFKQKFINNQVILLWDHIDENFQPTLLDFVWNIKQLSKNQQVLATQFRYSEKLAREFVTKAYKLIPYATDQIQKFHRLTEGLYFHIDYRKIVCFCDSLALSDRQNNGNHKVCINTNILMFKLILQTVLDLKMDLDCRLDLYVLFDTIFKKQFQDCPQKMTVDEKIMLEKFLQAHALKAIFGEELTSSLPIVKNHAYTQPSILHLDGIFVVNFDDNSVDFQHKIIEEYFVTKFIMDNVITVRAKQTTIKDAKILVTIFATIISKNTRLLNQINNALQLKYKNPHLIKRLHENICRIIKKAQYWPTVTELCFPLEPKFIENVDGSLAIINDFDFWRKFYRYIPYDDQRHDEVEKEKQSMLQAEIKKLKKKNKATKDKPTVKEVRSMKKLNYSHEISNQLNEFLEDMESDDSFDTDDIYLTNISSN